MRFYDFIYQVAFYSETRGRLDHALLWAHPVLEQRESWLRIDHQLEGICCFMLEEELFYGERPNRPTLTQRNGERFPFMQVHHVGAFRMPPKVAFSSTELGPLLHQMPADIVLTEKAQSGAGRCLMLRARSPIPLAYEKDELSENERKQIREYLTGSPVPLPALEIPTTPEKKQRWKAAS